MSLVEDSTHPTHIDRADPSAIQQSPEFVLLRRRLRLFVFPVSLAFFCWYMAFAVLSAYDRGFMKHKVTGEINMGTLFGLLQFVTTLVIALSYRRFADKKLDPQVDIIKELAGAGKE
ncbi:DUF485 domain-containing protein [Streptantibioticus rubrisoli]|uniref:DUF485 domain-containing protein n=1 Tax=Streptantibioticus rubrisoli TaxID=1387313 RepID=A0ABT1P567_9ACTN|nr:DUF485 domain-containing protein [Streptantibioticus rubrisoli]MCQ4040506.1 DUF485 domain-containing protein [Streptantibioticus rubrisoli]